MARRARRPAAPLLTVLPILVALAVGYAVFHGLAGIAAAPVDLGTAVQDLEVIARDSAEVERRWIGETFPDAAGIYVVAPAVHPPCAEGVREAPPRLRRQVAAALELADRAEAVRRLGEIHRQESSSWLPGFALGALLAGEGRWSEARTVLEEIAARPAIDVVSSDAVLTARGHRERRADTGPSSAEVIVAIHVLHVYGRARLETGQGGKELWRILRRPIGGTELLALRGATDRLPGMPSWARHRIPAPGCASRDGDLTSLDLYNNLIVAYLELGDDFAATETEDAWKAELSRDYNEPAEVNPLLAVLRRVGDPLDRQQAAWVRAISNAERLLQQRRTSGLGALDNPRLAFNLAQLMESALASSPDGERQALLAEQQRLLALARVGVGSLPPAESTAFHRALARLLLVDAVRRGNTDPLPAAVLADLEPGERETAAAIQQAHKTRRQPLTWLAAAAEGEASLAAALEERTTAWRSASRRDLAAALARQVAGRPRVAGLAAVWQARAVLARGDGKPAELRALEKELGFWWRLTPRALASSPWVRLALAALAGFLIWLVAAWLALQLRRRRDLFTSFYRLEARHKLRRAR